MIHVNFKDPTSNKFSELQHHLDIWADQYNRSLSDV